MVIILTILPIHKRISPSSTAFQCPHCSAVASQREPTESVGWWKKHNCTLAKRQVEALWPRRVDLYRFHLNSCLPQTISQPSSLCHFPLPMPFIHKKEKGRNYFTMNSSPTHLIHGQAVKVAAESELSWSASQGAAADAWQRYASHGNRTNGEGKKIIDLGDISFFVSTGFQLKKIRQTVFKNWPACRNFSVNWREMLTLNHNRIKTSTSCHARCLIWLYV